MGYCAQADLEAEISSVSLAQLTDDTAGLTINAVNLNAAITNADDIINGYLRAQHTVPLSTVPGIIKQISIDLTTYNLYKRRFGSEVNEGVRIKYTDAMQLLKDINTGKVLIDDSTSIQNTGGLYVSNKDSDSKIYTSDVWDTF